MKFIKEFKHDELNLAVAWESADFSELVQNLEPAIGRVLIEAGVLFVPPAGIFVSETLMNSNPPVGELSALHEHLCRGVGKQSCAHIEKTIINEISSNSIRQEFIDTRLLLFGVLLVLEPGNKAFADTKEVLLCAKEGQV